VYYLQLHAEASVLRFLSEFKDNGNRIEVNGNGVKDDSNNLHTVSGKGFFSKMNDQWSLTG